VPDAEVFGAREDLSEQPGNHSHLLNFRPGLLLGRNRYNYVDKRRCKRRLMGALMVSTAAFLLLVVLTNKIRITGAGISYTDTLRRKGIPWSAVRSLEITNAPMLALACCLRVVTDKDSVRIGSVSGSQAYIQRIIDDLSSFQRDQTTSLS
jgi:hypothetical protein